jgi:ABC-type branched-subunit amino acid transport system substrate-binding protein
MRTPKFLMLLAASAWVATTAAAQETLTIGFTVSQTGALNNDATSQKRGMEMWRDDVNA